MTSAILALLASPKVLAVLGAIGGFAVAVLTAFLKGRKAGKQSEMRKRIEAQQKALEERQKMLNEGSAVLQKAQGMSDAKAREEAMKWTRKS